MEVLVRIVIIKPVHERERREGARVRAERERERERQGMITATVKGIFQHASQYFWAWAETIDTRGQGRNCPLTSYRLIGADLFTFPRCIQACKTRTP